MDLLREQWKWLLVAALATGGWIARAEVSHFRADETTVRMAGIEEAVLRKCGLCCEGIVEISGRYAWSF